MFFQINADNTIAGFETKEQAAAAGTPEAITFADTKEMTAALMGQPAARILAIWNGFAGTNGTFRDLKPVRKFENNQIALVRIWKALQRLDGHAGEKFGGNTDVALPAPESATKIAKAKPGAAARVKKAPKADKPKAANKPAKTPKADKPKTERKPKAEDGSSKKATVIDMISKKNGATLQEIMDATGWQPHTTRGFISILGSKHGMKITSERRESDKARVYKLTD